MKTRKHVKQVLCTILSLCLLLSTAVAAHAEEDPTTQSALYSIQVQQVAVTDAEGYNVLGMAFTLTVSPAEENAEGASDEIEPPVLTNFDESARIELAFKLSGAVNNGYAVPVSYDAQQGLLQTKVYSGNGSAGMRIAGFTEYLPTRDISDVQHRVVVPKINVRFGDGLLYAENAKTTDCTAYIALDNAPMYDKPLVAEKDAVRIVKFYTRLVNSPFFQLHGERIVQLINSATEWLLNPGSVPFRTALRGMLWVAGILMWWGTPIIPTVLHSLYRTDNMLHEIFGVSLLSTFISNV